MQNLAQIIIFIAFIGLLGWTISNPFEREQLQLKSREDWLIDGIGLTIQGIFIPLLQATLVYWLYHYLLPNQQGMIKLSPIISLIISLIIVDYLYYWNHRLLHSKFFWSLHQVHHTVTQMDVLGTSRNTAWTSFLIIYLWIHPLFLYLLANPTAYLLGVSLTSALDLWRHSRLIISPNNWLYKFVSSWLILPQDHAWHHCSEIYNCNYGANFKLWDKLHGTYYENQELPSKIGIFTSLTLSQKLLFPFS
ncbi:sterol desaturase family protein [Calothrix sp. FACHB-1219]|uniref:sterol desaturase family protein n=1 Tax=unclassified Calothrix TaxID=2619626 RepID=UPI0016851A1C|nr:MULTISPECIES: sterol desaturase family protein [unclassified Calothrix]MBD2207512.1 sterol desaturase family protein [Calothrix sp. FACHB-168]MBD2222113.1 sterol desaturase family protein [Calothrix sp. FACHB-1219]